MACELPSQRGIPLSRFSLSELRREILDRGIVPAVSKTTVWRWLREDAIRPWRFRSWIFPRDSLFGEKASRVVDLYAGFWQGEPLGEADFVISADEKTSIQARARRHATQPAGPGRRARVEHEYERRGALVYLAAWDVHRAHIFGRCEPRSGIAPFDRLISHVMNQEPYSSAERVFWIVDNGSSHRGEPCVRRLKQDWPTIVPVHLPIHASWLNQIEIYFSIIQRKVLTPNDFSSLQELEDRLLAFQERFNQVADPFKWRFTRHDLKELLARLAQRTELLRAA